MKTIFKGEVQLLGWSDTHNGGAKLILQLSDPADLEPFKHLTSKHGKVAGQILGAVIVVPEDELEPKRSQEPTPDPQPKGGALAQLAGMWCRNIVFQEWLKANFPAEQRQASEALAEPDAYELARETVLAITHLPRLSWLDANGCEGEVAAFHHLIREPFAAYLSTRNAAPT